ncbi:YybS family protein [Nisaea acidiphila]|uniref:YybS family protein n=1 Tax=Nisaea acidiphila TaxID=1862145 RepID=A0A9J7ASR1_9PROT|nr:YybS family protein [Nisaea acidiphila]UUX49380.1 YybS family protein [Nisaea acidiphila]
MWSRWFPIGAAALASALMYLSTVLGSFGAILLAFLSPLPLFTVSLARGWMAGLTAVAGAGAIVLIASNSLAALFFVIISGLPAVLLTRKALLARPLNDDPENTELEWYPAGMLVMWLTALPAVGLLTAVLVAGLQGPGLETLVRIEVEGKFNALGTASEGVFALPQEQMDALINLTVAVLPGMAGLQWSMLILVNGLLAQGVLARFDANLRPSPKMQDIRLPVWAPFPLAIAALAAMLADGALGYLGWNAVPILCLPFLLSGLGLVHALAGAPNGKRWLLHATYTLMILSFVPYLASFLQLVWILLILAGLVDHWADLKGRIARNSNST